QVGDRGVGPQGGAGLVEALGRAGDADAVAQPAPQFRLPGPLPRQRAAGPVDVVFGRPGLEHARTVDAVAVVEVGQVPCAAEAPEAAAEIRWVGAGPA